MTFKETIKKASAEVDLWPQWMRDALGIIKVLKMTQRDCAKDSKVHSLVKSSVTDGSF